MNNQWLALFTLYVYISAFPLAWARAWKKFLLYHPHPPQKATRCNYCERIKFSFLSFNYSTCLLSLNSASAVASRASGACVLSLAGRWKNGERYYDDENGREWKAALRLYLNFWIIHRFHFIADERRDFDGFSKALLHPFVPVGSFCFRFFFIPPTCSARSEWEMIRWQEQRRASATSNGWPVFLLFTQNSLTSPLLCDRPAN